MTALPLLLLALAGTPADGEISERLAGPVTFTLISARPPVALELCVADAMSMMAGVAAFREGADRIVVVADDRGHVMGAVDVAGSAAGTRITGHIRARVWSDKIRDRIARCL